MGFCLQCNKWITQPVGKKVKQFCNNTCRSNYWYSKNKKVKSAEVPPIYDGPKLPVDFKGDEPLSFDKLKSEVVVSKFIPKVTKEAIMRKYVEDRRDCSCNEEFLNWLKRLEADEQLTRKDKELVKNTY